MINYIIWKNENTPELLIEILNECDLPNIQKEFLEKGYTILRVDHAFDKTFMKVVNNA
jgi:hypothetical protein